MSDSYKIASPRGLRAGWCVTFGGHTAQIRAQMYVAMADSIGRVWRYITEISFAQNFVCMDFLQIYFDFKGSKFLWRVFASQMCKKSANEANEIYPAHEATIDALAELFLLEALPNSRWYEALFKNRCVLKYEKTSITSA